MNPSHQGTRAGRRVRPGGTPDTEYAALVRAAQRGSRAALERLLMRAQEAAWRFSVLVCGGTHDAEDAMQEALVKTFRYVRRIREPEAFRAWLYRTVRNACLIGRRKRVGEPARFLSLDDLLPGASAGGGAAEPVDPGRAPDELAMTARLRRRLQTALARLPQPYRVVVVLRDVEGLSTREVARVAGISEANVKTRLHRARLLLRKALEDA
jgi:RNA polymerase sigma-70 factor (ECF subfamily)